MREVPVASSNLTVRGTTLTILINLLSSRLSLTDMGLETI